MSAASELITKGEVADLLHCSIRQVERLLKEGLPFVPVGTRKKLYNRQSVINWAKSRESCLSEKITKAAGTRKFASMDNDYTAYCRQAQEKKTQRQKRLN